MVVIQNSLVKKRKIIRVSSYLFQIEGAQGGSFDSSWAISVHGGGGEGKEHKVIKEFVYNNPESLGILCTIIMKTTAHIMNVHSLIYTKMVLALLEYHQENGVGL